MATGIYRIIILLFAAFLAGCSPHVYKKGTTSLDEAMTFDGWMKMETTSGHVFTFKKVYERDGQLIGELGRTHNNEISISVHLVKAIYLEDRNASKIASVFATLGLVVGAIGLWILFNGSILSI